MGEEEVANFEMGDAAALAEIDAGLAKQSLETLDVEKLTPLTHEVISRQATINIGTIGHVAHGKSTVVKAISGVKTVRFKKEMVSNITIKLGYANAKIFQIPDHPRPSCYVSAGSSTKDEEVDSETGKAMKLLRHVSFVDCPGHDILMATMLNGAAVMDAALLLIAGNEPCPQPQTSEHLAAVELMKLRNIIVLQNKIDLVKEQAALAQYEQIKNFLRGHIAEGSPIIPISAQLKYNIDCVLEYIVKKVPIPVRDFTSSPRMIVVRSFDVNKPGEDVHNLKGGVAGGSILRGVVRKGQEVEIRPGILERRHDGLVTARPIRTKALTLFSEQNPLQYAVPGGLIAVGTKIDPTLTRADRLVGQLLGNVDHMPEIFTTIDIEFFLLTRLLGVKDSDERGGKVAKMSRAEVMMVNIGSMSTGGKVDTVKGSTARLELTQPVCTEIGEKVALSRRIDKHWRLIGWGKITNGVTIDERTVGRQ
eukprot:TRINITY_DN6935_c0_g1_i1.p2 TRINITY_DN6935_c0_g1~~TRINITY_DN6935_c0_g1_i1.p2  ORF type:complete len:478 (+),score=187.87 TRINITY_DN6935_c0_g1_i1:71-1504(+)